MGCKTDTAAKSDDEKWTLKWAKRTELRILFYGRWTTVVAGTGAIGLSLYAIVLEPPAISAGILAQAVWPAFIWAVWSALWFGRHYIEGRYYPQFQWMVARLREPPEYYSPPFGMDWLPPMFSLPSKVRASPDAERRELTTALMWLYGLSIIIGLLPTSFAILVLGYVVPTVIQLAPTAGHLAAGLSVSLGVSVAAGIQWLLWVKWARPNFEARIGTSVTQALQACGYERSFFWGWQRSR